jgi:hypothetical protein
MKIWKDREGNWIDGKEFMSRWKSGINKVTPLQQVKSQLLFSWITVIGIICGIIVSIWQIKTLWWLGIILLAGLGNTIVGIIGIYQKYVLLENINKQMIINSIMEEHSRI